MPHDIQEEEELDDIFDNDIEEDYEDDDDDDFLTEYSSPPPLHLSQIFDPTTLAIGFDPSHLAGLDEQLIYSPQDAFLDLCWPADPSPPSLNYYPPSTRAHTVSPSLPSASNLSSIDSDSSPETCHNQYEDPRVRVHQFDGSSTKAHPYVSHSIVFLLLVQC